jgi:hypothetical protein
MRRSESNNMTFSDDEYIAINKNHAHGALLALERARIFLKAFVEPESAAVIRMNILKAERLLHIAVWDEDLPQEHVVLPSDVAREEGEE